jgi:hypothetical protein
LDLGAAETRHGFALFLDAVAMRRISPFPRMLLPCVATLSLLLTTCDVGTEPADQLSARLSVTPDVLQSPAERQLPPSPTVVVRVWNSSDRDVVLGGSSMCFLSFEVLDSSANVIMESPRVSRYCSDDIGARLQLAPGEVYEETMGWSALEYRDRKWQAVLPNGSYGLRAVVAVVDYGRVSLPPMVELRVAMDSM